MRIAVFLCYSVRCLYVFLCSFAVFVPSLISPPPPKKNSKMQNAKFSKDTQKTKNFSKQNHFSLERSVLEELLKVFFQT